MNEPVAVSASPARNWRWAPRESLASRLRVGRPGSKRFQRFLNKEFLETAQEDLESRDWDIIDFSTTGSWFGQLCDEHNRVVWEPFVDITEEEQDYLICAANDRQRKEASMEGAACNGTSPAARFERIERKPRRALWENPRCEFLQQVESEVIAFLHRCGSPVVEPLVMPLDGSPYHRLICHGVSQYYLLASYSRTANGQRSLIICKPRHVDHIEQPHITLSEFLVHVLKIE